MTVSQLIEFLQKQPSDAPVIISVRETAAVIDESLLIQEEIEERYDQAEVPSQQGINFPYVLLINDL